MRIVDAVLLTGGLLLGLATLTGLRPPGRTSPGPVLRAGVLPVLGAGAGAGGP